MKLRDYQANVVTDLYNAFANDKKRMGLIAGTAAGKTILASKLCLDATEAGKRVFFLVHLEKLIDQTAEKFTRYGLEVGFIKAGYEENPDALVQIGSIQTLNNRDWWRSHPADLIIFDEAHITLLSQVGKEILYETHPNAYVVALTATPKRLGNEQIGDHLDGFVCTPTPSELQAMGFLAPLRYFVPNINPDVSDLEVRGDDYDTQEIKNACFRPELISAIIKEWFLRQDDDGSYLCRGKRTLAFCVDIEHAKTVAHNFNRLGVPFSCLTSETPRKERDAIYEDFRSGKLLGISSINVISIGFDEPAAEVGLMLRPTASEALHFQQLGRLMRISPETGKRFGVILDQAGNTTRLGIPEDIKEYALPVSKEKLTGGEMPTKACPQCDRIVPTFTVDCQCGHHWVTKFEINTNGMIEIPVRGAYPIEELKDKFKLYRMEAFHKGDPPTIAEKKFALEFGISPLEQWYANSTLGGSDRLKNAYIDYLSECAKMIGKDKEWAIQQYLLEFGVAA